MFDYCEKIELVLPHRLFFVAKTRVVSEGNGRICHYGSDVRVIGRLAFPSGPPSGSADVSSRARPEQAAARAEDSTDTDEMSVVDPAEVDLRSFGVELSLSEKQNELEEVVEITAVDSADKTVPKIRTPKDDSVVMMGKLSEAVDFGRYVPAVGTNTGKNNTLVDEFGKENTMGKYTRAIEIIQKKYRSAKTILKTSNSYIINIHRNFDTVATKAARWQQWHISWVYGFRNYMQE